jgi:predicted ATPase
MFTRIQTLNFRSLKSVDQLLGHFQALVGPNASGKTTFLDVIGMLSDIVRNRGDVRETIGERSTNFEKLLWLGRGDAFQLAVEAEIPEVVRLRMSADKQTYGAVRYEVDIGIDRGANEIGLNHETLWLIHSTKRHEPQRDLFPSVAIEGPSVLSVSGNGRKTLINKKVGGNDNYYPEGSGTYRPSYRLGRTKSALANIPADEGNFPVCTWFRDLLETGVQNFVLNSQIIRQPSPPGLGLRFQTDGSNLPWVVAELRKDAKRFKRWLDHVRTALEDVRDIDTVELEENRHRYLVVEYANGARVPSWLVSDGTLRLLALTIPAYLKDMAGIFLIEEPENGIHPKAIETVLQSLSSIYGGQVLIATHSPVALNMLPPNQVLCFAKDELGATDIVNGGNHPALRNWKRGQPDLGVLFAAGILS